jgi:hypothetical protein
VRSIGTEILVGKTELSYTYTQPVRAGQPYIQYHGTLEARPVTATTSKIVYTLMWDNSPLADDAAKEADKTRRRTQFQTAVDNMKILAKVELFPRPQPWRWSGGGRGGRPAVRLPPVAAASSVILHKAIQSMVPASGRRRAFNGRLRYGGKNKEQKKIPQKV